MLLEMVPGLAVSTQLQLARAPRYIGVLQQASPFPVTYCANGKCISQDTAPVLGSPNPASGRAQGTPGAYAAWPCSPAWLCLARSLDARGLLLRLSPRAVLN